MASFQWNIRDMTPLATNTNGGILSTLILEIISITIYFLIGKLARYLRKLEGLEIDEIAKLEELKEEGKEVLCVYFKGGDHRINTGTTLTMFMHGILLG